MPIHGNSPASVAGLAGIILWYWMKAHRTLPRQKSNGFGIPGTFSETEGCLLFGKEWQLSDSGSNFLAVHPQETCLVSNLNLFCLFCLFCARLSIQEDCQAGQNRILDASNLSTTCLKSWARWMRSQSDHPRSTSDFYMIFTNSARKPGALH